MSKCPTCGADDAYVGLNEIECRNPECPHHAERCRRCDKVRCSCGGKGDGKAGGCGRSGGACLGI